MLNSVNDKSPLILQGIVKPERTIYLPDSHELRGEITYIEEDIRQIKTEQATQNTAIATNQALINRAEGNIDILYGQDRNQSILIEQNRASILSLHEEVSTLQGGKVDKIYDPNIVYGTNDAGAAVGIPYSANSDPLSIIQRDENGCAQIESPLNDKDIANKEFVENLVKPVSVNVQSNTAKIENLTNILLDNEQVAIAEVSQAFTTRQTADGENIIDEQNVFPKLIKGSTVKSANLIPYPFSTTDRVQAGVTFSSKDGVITANGTATSNSNMILALNITGLPSGTYTYSGVKNGSETTYYIQAYVDDVYRPAQTTVPVTIALNEGQVITRLLLFFKTGTVFNNVVIKPMLNKGDTALPFRPYFSGLKNAYLQSIVSTNADNTENDTFNLPETLELGEYDSYNPKTGYVARYTEYATSETGFTEEQLFMVDGAILSADGKTLAYKKMSFKGEQYTKRDTHYTAWNGGSETQVQGETDNSADGAMCTLTNDYFVKVGGATNEQTE